jgi:hypothetical protein
MRAEPAIDWDHWSGQQLTTVKEIFGEAADELKNLGVRLLVGSEIRSLRDEDEAEGITLVPPRFDGAEGNLLNLSLIVTKAKGPPRYVITLLVSGHQTIQALHALAKMNMELWERFFLGSGLWIGYEDDLLPFIDLCQILERNEPGIILHGVYLHSELNRTYREGVMVLGTLYRSILDRLNDVNSFGPFFARLKIVCAHPPRYRGSIRP